MSFGKKAVLAGLLMAAMFCSVSAMAEETRVSRPIWDQMTEKLGRGIANIAFGPLELLIKPYDVANEDGAIPALTYGVFKGIIFTIAREVVGIIDVLTFFMPLPDCPWDEMDGGWGYGPIMRPAWVIDTEHNAFNFFLNEQTIVDAR